MHTNSHAGPALERQRLVAAPTSTQMSRLAIRSRTPRCRSSRSTPSPPNTTARPPSDAGEAHQHNGERIAGEELYLEEHPEEPDAWEESLPMATRLPTRGRQSRSQIAAIDAACLKVASSRRQQPRYPSARRTTQGRAGQKASLEPECA